MKTSICRITLLSGVLVSCLALASTESLARVAIEPLRDAVCTDVAEAQRQRENLPPCFEVEGGRGQTCDLELVDFPGLFFEGVSPIGESASCGSCASAESEAQITRQGPTSILEKFPRERAVLFGTASAKTQAGESQECPGAVASTDSSIAASWVVQNEGSRPRKFVLLPGRPVIPRFPIPIPDPCEGNGDIEHFVRFLGTDLSPEPAGCLSDGETYNLSCGNKAPCYVRLADGDGFDYQVTARGDSQGVTDGELDWTLEIRPALSYAALGDSFASGVGAGREDPASGTCRRSSDAFSRILDPDKSGGFFDSRLGKEFIDLEFLACSGSGTAGVLEQLEEERNGLRLVDDNTDLITIWTGGNDLGWGSIARLCGNPHLGDCWNLPFPGTTLTVLDVFTPLLDQLETNLGSFLSIARERAPNALIAVMNYPYFVPEGEIAITRLSSCIEMELYFNDDERFIFRALTDLANGRIASAVALAQAVLVDVNDAFDGREACARYFRSPWMTGLLPRSTTFHPNDEGHRAVERLLRHKLLDDMPPDRSTPRSNDKLTLETPVAPTARFGDIAVDVSEPIPCSGGSAAPGAEIRVSIVQPVPPGEKVDFSVQASAGPIFVASATASDAGIAEAVFFLPGETPSGTVLVQGIPSETLTWFTGSLRVAVVLEDDLDTDGVVGMCDNCPDEPNADQIDRDGDGVGDVCDTCPDDSENDVDTDGLCADSDPCPGDFANDVDGDGVCGDEDNCPIDANANQTDSDFDGRGDVCNEAECFDVELTIEPEEGGYVLIGPPTCPGATFQAESTITVEAFPLEGYRFAGFSGEVSTTDKRSTFVIGGETSVSALFEFDGSLTATPTVPRSTVTPANTPAPTTGESTATITPTGQGPTVTPEATHSVAPTRQTPASVCAGDCDGNGIVAINELITGVNIALSRVDVSACEQMDTGGDGGVQINELVRAVRNALEGCA